MRRHAEAVRAESSFCGTHLADRLVAMLLLELSKLRLLCRDLLGQHALQGGQRPLAARKAAEGALQSSSRVRYTLFFRGAKRRF